jgi:hypothetical protein
MIVDCYDKEVLDNFKKGLGTMARSFKKEYGQSYQDSSLEERTSFLNKQEDDMEAYYRTKSDADPEHYYRVFKELVLLGFITSEIGCTMALEYVPVPGRYEGCIRYDRVNKAWAPN